jgi:hypothetical protein
MTSTIKESRYRWDREVLSLFRDHAVGYFSKLDIWEQDWIHLARSEGFEPADLFGDPRTRLEKTVHKWLARSQRSKQPIVKRVVDRAVKILPGW